MFGRISLTLTNNSWLLFPSIILSLPNHGTVK